MIPVILSGGSGTRLWPVSRASYPKQFCDFFDGSFLGHTIERLQPLGDVHVLTTKSMEALTNRAAKRGGLGADSVIFEPMPKNTGPAVALLCHWLNARGRGDEIVGVFPSDHLIGREEEFRRAVDLAAEVAKEGFVVTLGVPAKTPATGYGYIEVGDERVGARGELVARRVRGFREKPDLETAKGYVRAGNFCWNAGMFVFRAKDMIHHFETHQPALWARLAQIAPDLSNAAYHYAQVDAISLDYAVMEKLEAQACVPCDMDWSDVGSWDEMARLTEETSPVHSSSRAEVFSLAAHDNYVHSVHNKVIGLIDVTGLLVVDTPDALLVARKGSSQKVKDLVEVMREAGQIEATEHPFETRPWGRFEILADEPQFKAKKIIVDPGGQLSYQSHQHRAEHWTVIAGHAEVVLDGETTPLGPDQFVYIPAGAKHRIRNPGRSPVVLIEVQTGSYFGEDDITRYSDDYNRS